MATQLRPIIRDVVFLVVGVGVFLWEVAHDARWGPMVLAMLMSLGPSFVQAYWARTQASGSSPSPGSSSPSPLPSTSPSGGEP